MNTSTVHLKRVTLAMMALSSMAMGSHAFAAAGETTAGTDITNVASVSYSVGGTAQTAVTASNLFKVDRKVNVTVTGGNTTTTVPGKTAVATLFSVTNTGNASDTFNLVAANVVGDSFDVSNINIYADNGTTAGVFDAGDTQVTTSVTLARDTQTNYFIVADMPATPLNTHTALVKLTATTTSTATTGADTNGVDVVIVNSTANANDTYSIQTAALDVSKTATVKSDGIDINNLNPKAIPGATVEYTITINNTGATAADNVTVVDAGANSVFNAGNVTYVDGSMKLGNTALTDAADADGGVVAGSPVNSITVNAGTIAPNSSATVTFQVKIK